jgi:Uma2 family endonuclease
MSEPQKMQRLSVEEYLTLEENDDYKHEYVNGSIFAMTGASRKHATISLNIASFLRNSLRGSGCDVFISDMKVYAKAANSFYYPDVVIECNNALKHDQYSDSPTIIFEVLSKSTVTTDRREKLVAYQKIDSLQSYVLVHQSRKLVFHFERAGEEWVMQEISGIGELILKCSPDGKPTVRIETDVIYDNVQVDDGPDLQVLEEAEALVW